MKTLSPNLALLLLVLFLAACGSSESPASPASDGDTEALENETGEQEAESCDFTGARCQGPDVVSCTDARLSQTACGEGRYCDFGQCQAATISLPKDAAPHNEVTTEWWYYTGHLTDGTGQWGFEVTIFQYDVGGTVGMGYMCHVAVTDKVAKEHYHQDNITLKRDIWKSKPIDLKIKNCEFKLGGDGRDHIYGIIPKGDEKDGKASPWEIELTVEPQKRPVFHGGDGIIPMSDAGGTSYYYSYTRLSAAGRLVTPTGEVAVTGQAWMDHQWGDFFINEFKGWDWWSMQFEDGNEVMLFQFRNWDSKLVVQAGTLIDPLGNFKELSGLDSFAITSLRQWDSPHTDGIYPLDWNIRIPEGDWTIAVRTQTDDQEMWNAAQNYWEGDTTLSGTRGTTTLKGVGYTELTGYATDKLDPKR